MWYNVVKGKKIFWIVEPSKSNLEVSERSAAFVTEKCEIPCEILLFMATSTLELAYSTIFDRSLFSFFVENATRFARRRATSRTYAKVELPGNSSATRTG